MDARGQVRIAPGRAEVETLADTLCEGGSQSVALGADIAARPGLETVLCFDMGGATARIRLIRNPMPKAGRVLDVARTCRFTRGSGLPLSIPGIETVESGADGGSPTWVADVGRRDAPDPHRPGKRGVGPRPRLPWPGRPAPRRGRDGG